MKKQGWIVFVGTFVLGLFMFATNAQALSPETEVLLKLLEKKGVITKGEAAALRQEVEAAAAPAADKEALKAEIKEELREELKAEGGPLAGIQDNITISGAVEADYQYKDHREISDKNSDGTSDLFISTVEIGVEAAINDWTTASVVFIAEDIWKEGGNEDATALFDQAFVTFQNEEKLPFYAIIGKTDLPFGNFFTHTVSDTETYNAYLINGPAATFGFARPELFGLDVSFTIYEGEKLIKALEAAEIGWARSNTATYSETDDVESYVARLSVEPMEGLMLGVAFDSEPGDSNDRNETFNAFGELSMAGFTLDAEYFDATSREKHFTDNKTYEEKAFVVGLAYQVMDPFEVAARYEDYDIGHDTDTDGDLDYVLALGANYELLKDVTLMGEYRRLSYETQASTTYEDTVNEFNLRVAVGF
jgi:hypothetical protein